jgi:hypothetical protein
MSTLNMFAAGTTIEPTARISRNTRAGVLSCWFNSPESGFVVRPNPAWNFGSYRKLRFLVQNTNSREVKLNIKFWGQQNTYQTWYVPVPAGVAGYQVIEIDLGGVRDFVGADRVLIMKISCDDVHANVVRFKSVATFATQGLVADNLFAKATNITCDDNLLVNGSFQLGLLAWGFWAGNGRWKASVVKSAADNSVWARLNFVERQDGVQQTDAWFFSDVFKLPAGSYRFSVKTNNATSSPVTWRWFLAGAGAGQSQKLSGQFYIDQEPAAPGIQTHTGTFTVSSDGEFQLYLAAYSAASLSFSAAELCPVVEAVPHFEADGSNITLDGTPAFQLGFYGEEPAWLAQYGFNAVKPRRWPDKAYLDACQQANIAVWADLTGFTRMKLFDYFGSLSSLLEHPVVKGIYLCDEPDHGEYGIPASVLRAATARLDDEFLTWTTVMSWNESAIYEYADSASVIAGEIYPVINGGWTMAKCADVAHRIALAAAGKPFFIVPEIAPSLADNQQKCLLYMALASGSNGMFIWDEGSGSNPAKMAVVADAISDMADATTEFGELVLRFKTATALGCCRITDDTAVSYLVNFTANPVTVSAAIPDDDEVALYISGDNLNVTIPAYDLLVLSQPLQSA